MGSDGELSPLADDHSPQKGRGRRCAVGCESWPDKDEYRTCPICGEATKAFNNLIPLPEDEAASKAAHALFEDFYEEWCDARGQTVTGPLAWDAERFGPEPTYVPDPPKPTKPLPRIPRRRGGRGGVAHAAAG